MGAIASQITILTIVYSIVYSDADQRKHQSSAWLAFVRGIHRGPAQMASYAENVSIWWRHHDFAPNSQHDLKPLVKKYDYQARPASFTNILNARLLYIVRIRRKLITCSYTMLLFVSWAVDRPCEQMEFIIHNLFINIDEIPSTSLIVHDDVIKWKHFPRYWPSVMGIYRSPVDSPHNGQWRGALMSFLCAAEQTTQQTVQAPVPLSIFRSNSKFDENSECSSFEYTRPITTIFCTRHDSDTVVTCAKYRCDRPRIFYTRVFWIFIEFRIRSKYA